MLLIYSFCLGAASFHLPFPHKHQVSTLPVYTLSSPSVLTLLKTVSYTSKPHSPSPPDVGKCCQRPWHWQIWQTLLFNLILWNLQWQLSLLVMASWKHSPSFMFMEKAHPAFLCLFPSQNASPASLGSLPCEVQVAFTDLSLAFPHSPASGQSHLYQWLHLEFRRFSKHAALDVSLACQTQQDRVKQSSHGMWEGFRGQNENSAHHSGHLLCLEPRHMGAPNAGKWSSWMPRREWHSAGKATS